MRVSIRCAWIVAGVLLLGQSGLAQGLGGIRNPFNNKPIGEQIGDGRKGPQLFPRPTESYSTFGDPVSGHVIIQNRTKIPISDSINGHQKPRIAPGASVRWNLTGNTEHPPVFHVAFDNGRKRTVSYRLKTDSTNYFTFAQGGLDLHRR